MANSFSKEEIVAFEQILEGFQDALIMSRNVSIYKTDQVTMERAKDTIWRPQPYISTSFDGLDQTANFTNYTQLSVPASLGFIKSVPWTMGATELRDALQANRLGESARQRLASDINVAVMNTAALQGTLVVKRTGTPTGYDDIAQCESIMNEQGIPFEDRVVGIATRDYNSLASNLAARQTLNGKTQTAYDKSLIGEVASFRAFKMDYGVRLAAAAGVTVTMAAANQFYTPVATDSSTGGILNVDNRYQTISIAVTSGAVKVGDSFTINGVNAVHHITKQDTGQLKTFRIIKIVTGAGGTGTVVISPPIISAQGGTAAEVQYKNVTATPINGAGITFLNTVSAFQNPFWQKDAIELLPGRLAVPTDAGMSVMRASTDQGIEIVMSKQVGINDLSTKYRLDTSFGTCLKQPEMAGIVLFNQT